MFLNGLTQLSYVWLIISICLSTLFIAGVFYFLFSKTVIKNKIVNEIIIISLPFITFFSWFFTLFSTFKSFKSKIALYIVLALLIASVLLITIYGCIFLYFKSKQNKGIKENSKFDKDLKNIQKIIEDVISEKDQDDSTSQELNPILDKKEILKQEKLDAKLLQKQENQQKKLQIIEQKNKLKQKNKAKKQEENQEKLNIKNQQKNTLKQIKLEEKKLAEKNKNLKKEKILKEKLKHLELEKLEYSVKKEILNKESIEFKTKQIKTDEKNIEILQSELKLNKAKLKLEKNNQNKLSTEAVEPAKFEKNENQMQMEFIDEDTINNTERNTNIQIELQENSIEFKNESLEKLNILLESAFKNDISSVQQDSKNEEPAQVLEETNEIIKNAVNIEDSPEIIEENIAQNISKEQEVENYSIADDATEKIEETNTDTNLQNETIIKEQEIEVSVKRGRGRPRKILSEEEIQKKSVKGKRGRPSKKMLQERIIMQTLNTETNQDLSSTRNITVNEVAQKPQVEEVVVKETIKEIYTEKIIQKPVLQAQLVKETITTNKIIEAENTDTKIKKDQNLSNENEKNVLEYPVQENNKVKKNEKVEELTSQVISPEMKIVNDIKNQTTKTTKEEPNFNFISKLNEILGDMEKEHFGEIDEDTI